MAATSPLMNHGGATETAAADRTPSLSLHSMMQHKATAKAPIDLTKEDIITEQPAGSRQLWSKACSYYSNSIFGITQGSSDGMPCTIVEGEDGAFYIYAPFSGIDTRSWLRADIDGDRMTIHLPQAIYTDKSPETDTEYLYVAQLCYFQSSSPDGEGLYYPYEGEREIILNKEGDSWVMVTEEANEHPVIMGLVAADDGTWCAFSDWDISLTPFNEKPVEAPASLATSEWTLLFPDTETGDYAGGFPVTVGIDGSDIYLKGFTSSFADAWIKGTTDGRKATFPSRQYMGANENTNTFAYFFGGESEHIYNEEWDFWYDQVNLVDELTFDIDPESGLYTTEGVLLVNRGSKAVNTVECLTAPRMHEQGTVTDFTPRNPIPGYFSEPGDWAGSIYFTFPNINAADQLLDTSKLYYRFYVDGEPFVFYSDEFEGVEDGTEEIPFDFTNQNNLGRYGTANLTHFIYFSFTGYESLALQTVYIDGDEEYASDIVYVVGGDPGSVDTLAGDTAEPVATSWLDLSGRSVANPASGLYIRVRTYADGSRKAEKVIVK